MMPYGLLKICIAILLIGAFDGFLPVTAANYRAIDPWHNHSRTGSRGESGIAQISERWAKEWSAKKLDALISLYADDAVFLTATGTRVTGRAAIRDLFEKALASNSSALRVQSKGTEQSGNLAYDSGEYEESTSSSGVTKSGRGNYLVVLRRDKNHWLIVQHMWTDAPTQ